MNGWIAFATLYLSEEKVRRSFKKGDAKGAQAAYAGAMELHSDFRPAKIALKD